MPSFSTNLLSVGALWDSDRIDTIFRDRNEVVLPDGDTIKFDPKSKALKISAVGPRALMGTQGKRSTKPDTANLERVHSRLMHCGEARTKAASWRCEGVDAKVTQQTLTACDACLRGNSRNKATCHRVGPVARCVGVGVV